MPRPAKSEIATLLQEARAVELLAEEADVAPERLQDYWDVSAELITVVGDMERLQVERPAATAEDPEVFSLRHRLRSIASRLTELSLD